MKDVSIFSYLFNRFLSLLILGIFWGFIGGAVRSGLKNSDCPAGLISALVMSIGFLISYGILSSYFKRKEMISVTKRTDEKL